jgi:hypothetical protein
MVPFLSRAYRNFRDGEQAGAGLQVSLQRPKRLAATTREQTVLPLSVHA